MNHLTIEEILDFVSMNQINDKTLKLASKVNTHIRRCPECLRKVNAFQTVYDEFERMGKAHYFSSVKRVVESNPLPPEKSSEIADLILKDNPEIDI